jgi:stage IV sporulation protein FB
MFGQPISLGNFFGLHVRVDTSLLILLLMYAMRGAANGGGPEGMLHALTFAALVLISVFLHEYGHAFAGSLFGISTVEVVLHFFGGYTQYSKPPRTPLEEAVMSGAGPLTNLALAGTAYLIMEFLKADPGRYDLLYPAFGLLEPFWYINLYLGLLNLLPGFPLDGGGVVRAILSLFLSRAWARLIVAYLGVAIGFGLAAYGMMTDFAAQVILGLLLVYIATMEANDARRSIM